MGLFRNFPYSNFHEMNMDEILKTVKNLVEEWSIYHATWDTWQGDINSAITEFREWFDTLDIQSEVDNKIDEMIENGEFITLIATYLPFVTPEMYGAAADGIADDSEAIQNAIDNNTSVVFTRNTYKIDSTINIGEGKKIWGDNTKIIGSANPIFHFQSYETSQNHSAKPITMDGFNITGDDTNTLITVDRALKVTLTNINMYQFETGLHFISGYELFVENIRMVGNIISATGMLIDSGDSTFKNIVMRDVHTALDVRKGRNLFENVHCWILNPDIFPNSIMVKSSALGGATNIYNDMYFDTYHKPIVKSGLSYDIFNNPINVVLKAVIDAVNITNGIFLTFTEENPQMAGKVAIYNYMAQLINDTFYDLCNYTTIPFKFTLGIGTYNTVSLFDKFNKDGFYSFAADTTKQFGEIRLTPNTIEFNILINVTNAHVGHYNDNVITFNNKIWFPTIVTFTEQYSDGSSLLSDVEVDFISNGVRVRGYGSIYLKFSIPYNFIA